MPDNIRNCIKCGSSPSKDAELTLHRFPKPGNTNSLRCELWAKYSFPDEPWASPEFQQKLYSQHKMLCNKHFMVTCFVDKKLFRTAVPSVYLDEVPTWIKETGQEQVHNKGAKRKKIDEEPSEPAQECNEANPFISCPSPSHSDKSNDELEAPIFSWQKTIPVPLVKDEELNTDLPQPDKDFEIDKLQVLQILTDDTSPKDDEPEQEYKSEKHAEFSCDYCMGDIIGFRYTCVQCENYDLCRACEHSLVHPQHYMLRVPRPTKHTEIKAVVAAIRSKLALLEESLRNNASSFDDVEIKKEEDPFPFELEEPVLPMETAENPVSSQFHYGTEAMSAGEEENVVPNADPENENNKYTKLINISSDVQDIYNEDVIITDANFNSNINSVSTANFNIGNQPKVVLYREPLNISRNNTSNYNVHIQPRVVLNREPLNLRTTDNKIKVIVKINKERKKDSKRSKLYTNDSGKILAEHSKRIESFIKDASKQLNIKGKRCEATVFATRERTTDSKRMKLLETYKGVAELNINVNRAKGVNEKAVKDSNIKKLFVRDEDTVVNPREVQAIENNRDHTIEEYIDEIWLDDTFLHSEEIVDSAGSAKDSYS